MCPAAILGHPSPDASRTMPKRWGWIAGATISVSQFRAPASMDRVREHSAAPCRSAGGHTQSWPPVPAQGQAAVPVAVVLVALARVRTARRPRKTPRPAAGARDTKVASNPEPTCTVDCRVPVRSSVVEGIEENLTGMAKHSERNGMVSGGPMTTRSFSRRGGDGQQGGAPRTSTYDGGSFWRFLNGGAGDGVRCTFARISECPWS